MRVRHRSVIALAAMLLAAFGCGRGTSGVNGPGDAPSADEVLGFVPHTDAVDFPSASDWIPYGSGLRDLVPLDDCVLGVGVYANGHRNVGATWIGNADCTELRLDPEPDGGEANPEDAQGWSGAPFGGARSIIDLGEGAMLALSGESLVRRGPDGGVERLADFDLPSSALPGEGGDRAGVCGLAATDDGAVVSGHINDEWLLWRVSEDGAVAGPEPLTASGDAAVGLCHLAADGNTVVGLSRGAVGQRIGWYSADAGRSWATAPIDGLSREGWVLDLHRADDGWRAVVTGDPAGEPVELVLLDSADGLAWTVSGRQHLGDGQATDLACGPDGAPIVIGDVWIDPGADKRKIACNFVLVANGTWPDFTWERGELGCVENDPVRAVATLADGRVVIAGNSDLWIRPDLR